MKRKNPERPFSRSALALAVGLAFASAAPRVAANPTGSTVVAGNASFASSGKTLNITNTPGAIINWDQFSIAKDEITRFIQQNAASAVLNRVTGQNPSTILGQLLSNGRVFLINPSGIAFGRGAVIDVAGLAASTLNISDADFLSGRMRFAGTGAEGKLTNAGTVRTPEGGKVYLIAPNIENQASGVITSPKGEVVITAGRSVELVNAGTPDIRVELTAPANETVNAGQVLAASGRVGIYGTLIRSSGLVSASRAEAGDGGKIVLKAAGDATIEGAGRVEATGAHGGTIQILGNRVSLTDSASLDASGDLRGGTVLVGGDAHGANPDVQNAWRTYVGPNATIRADARTQGDGGKVVVWSDDVTAFYGSLSARGGANAGDGGFAEVSGKENLIFDGRADLSAAAGTSGSILFDPRDITVAAGASLVDPTQILFGTPGSTTDVTISNSSLNNLSTGSVILQAQRDINVNAPVSLQNNVDFIAQAGHDVVVNATLFTNGLLADKGRIHLEADSPHPVTSPSWFDGAGAVRVNALVSSCGGTGALANCQDGNHNGGNITLIAGGNQTGNSPSSGGFQLGADVIAGNGGINVALAQSNASLDFFIGAGGNTQLSSSDTGSLKTTGPLALGQALSGGNLGLGDPGLVTNLTPWNTADSTNDNAILLTVNSITNSTSTPIQLSPDSGSSFQLIAGSGGITLDKPLTTYQDTTISTTGALTINNTLSTSNNNLTIDASSVTLGSSGSVNVGSGSLTCTGTNCGSLTPSIYWDGGAGTLNWFDALNWSTNLVPTGTSNVTIEAAGTVLIASNAAVANTLVTLSPLEISSGSLTLSNSSTFGSTLLLSGGTLAGAGGIAMGGASSALTWSGGTMASGGDFLLGAGHTGTLSNSLVLSRNFLNEGALLFSNATLSGTGTLTSNTGTIDPGSRLTLAGATLDLGGSAGTLASLALNSGTVTGSGSITVADFARSGALQDGGAFGTGFSAIDLTHIGDFAVPGYTASNSVALHSSGGRVTLNGTVSAGGSGDAIVISGSGFTNSGGALSAPSGRWLVWSSDPAADSRGSLAYDFKQYNATYGSSAVLGTGKGLLYSVAPTVGATLGGSASKTYNGDSTAPTGSLVLSYGSGAIDSDSIAGLSPLSASYDDKNAGTGKLVTVSDASFSATSADAKPVYGYQFTPASAGVGTVTPATLTLAGQSGVDKTYDGTASMPAGTSGYGSLGGTIYGSDIVALAGAAAYDSKNAGARAVQQGTLALAGTDASNYQLNWTDGSGTITPAPLSVTANDASKTYGQALTFNGTEFTSSGLQNSETIGSVTLNSAGAAATASVAGSPYAIVPSAATGGTFSASNYTITYNNGALTVNPAVINLAGSRVYDGATDFAAAAFGAGGTIGTGINSETLAVSGTGSVASKNAGTQSLALGSLALGNGTGLASNYTLTGGLHTGTITPRAITVASSFGQGKTYGDDDPASAKAAYQVTGLAGTDSVTGNMGRAAGETVGGYAFNQGSVAVNDGNGGNNYALTFDGATNKFQIAQRGLTASIADQTKTYGTSDPAPAGIGVALGNVVNRAVADINGNSTAIDDTTKVATSLAGLARTAGESVGAYAITGGTLNALTGASAANYSGATLDTTGKMLSITQAPALTATIPDQTKTYGTDDPALSGIGVNLSGVVNTTVSTWNGSVTINDTRAVTGTLSSLSRTAGEDVGSYAITGGTVALTGGGNYAGATLDPTGNTLAIGKATLSSGVSANPAKVYGTDDPALGAVSLSTTGLVNGVTLTDWNGTNTSINDTVSLASLTRSAGESVGSYAIMGGALSLSAPGNYNAGFSAGGHALDITRAAALTGTIAGQTKVYGTDDPAVSGIGVTLSGLVNRTVSTWNGSVLLDDTGAVTTSLAGLARTAGETVGAYSITGGTLNALSGASANNYAGATLSTAGDSLSITPAMLTGTIADQTKTYGTNDPALSGIPVSLSGTVNATVTDWNGTPTVINDAGNVTASLASLTRQAGENVGSYAITDASFNFGGARGSNYSATLGAAGKTLSITQAPALTGTIADQTKAYGTNDPAISGIPVTLSGTVNATVTDWNGSSTPINDTANVTATLASLTRQAGENAGSYSITGGTLNALSGASAANYSGTALSTSGRALAITPATLTYVADPVTREFGMPNPAFTGSYAGLLNTTVTDWNGNTTTLSGASSISGALQFTGAATQSSPVGQYPILGSGLSSQNYVFVQSPANATALTVVEQAFSDSLLNQVVHSILDAPVVVLAPASTDSDDEKRRLAGSQSCK